MKYKGKVKVTGTRQITLPAEMCRDLGIGRGDILEVERVEGGLWIRPALAEGAPAEQDPMWGLIGAFEGPAEGDPGADHDRWIAEAKLGKCL